MADFPQNLKDDGEHRLPSDVVSELFGSPKKMSHSTSPASFSAKTTHDIINSHGKESLVRSVNAKVRGGFSGPDYSFNYITRGGGFVPWYGAFHPVPVPVLAGHIQVSNNPYPNQQAGPIETYDYPFTMFAPTTPQIQQGSGKAMMPVPMLHHHRVNNNNNRVEVEINAKCGGTGVFLPSKEIASTSRMKNSKPKESTTTGGGDAVVSTRIRKKSGKIMQGNEKNNTMKEWGHCMSYICRRIGHNDHPGSA